LPQVPQYVACFSLSSYLILIFPEPRSVSDAIYSGVSGAKFTNVSGLGGIWTLPCDQEVNFSFVFSGVKFPIHPLDANMNGTDLGLTLSNGDSVCFGPVGATVFVIRAILTGFLSQFQPFSFDSTFGSGQTPLFDMILGMAFCMSCNNL